MYFSASLFYFCKNSPDCFSFQFNDGKCDLGALIEDSGDVTGAPIFVYFNGKYCFFLLDKYFQFVFRWLSRCKRCWFWLRVRNGIVNINLML